MNRQLHITNGESLTTYLKAEKNCEGSILTWQEMLCEGPTIAHIDSDLFFENRVPFFENTYGIDYNTEELKFELDKLNQVNDYDEIVLWFEYDLFCHINMIGVISLIHQKEIKKPLFLVCSGRIKGEKSLKGLSELSASQLKTYFENKILLTQEDINLAVALWRTYCGKDHRIFKPYITTASSFPYLSNCIKAHIQRFPLVETGLNLLEHHILNFINSENIKSINQLLGYVINYQGFYGYGDIQLQSLINKLSMFYKVKDGVIKLNKKGVLALNKEQNFSADLTDEMTYGGVSHQDYVFDEVANLLILKSGDKS